MLKLELRCKLAQHLVFESADNEDEHFSQPVYEMIINTRLDCDTTLCYLLMNGKNCRSCII